MKCSFCEIVAALEDGQVVFEDDLSLAFLDRRPLFPGHCLLVPRAHVSTLNELDNALIAPLFRNAKLLTCAVQQALTADGTFVAINNTVSQSVPHLHIHIVPRRKKDGLKGFFWPRNPYRDEAHMHATRTAIQSAVQELKQHFS